MHETKNANEKKVKLTHINEHLHSQAQPASLPVQPAPEVSQAQAGPVEPPIIEEIPVQPAPDTVVPVDLALIEYIPVQSEAEQANQVVFLSPIQEQALVVFNDQSRYPSPALPEASIAELQSSLNDLRELVRSGNHFSDVNLKSLESFKKTMLSKLSYIKKDMEAQLAHSAEVKRYNNATAEVLSDQISRASHAMMQKLQESEQRLDAKIDSIGSQLTEVIFFLQNHLNGPGNDKRGKENLLEAMNPTEGKRRLGAKLRIMMKDSGECLKKKEQENRPKRARAEAVVGGFSS